MRLILGSESPRRKEILDYFNIPFQVAFHSFQENLIPCIHDPEEYVIQVSEGKLNSLVRLYPEALILTADTTVYCEGKIFGKPIDENDAFRILHMLQGKWHSVFTGIVLQRGTQRVRHVEETKVRLTSLSDTLIKKYVSAGQWSDKAAGYAIQKSCGLIVEKIDGCFYNVMGLPIHAVWKSLDKFGISLWDHLK